MGDLLFWAAVLGGGAWAVNAVYKDGKRAGSRKAYGVGRRHGRRR
jgi:hypothetical protein